MSALGNVACMWWMTWSAVDDVGCMCWMTWHGPTEEGDAAHDGDGVPEQDAKDAVAHVG